MEFSIVNSIDDSAIDSSLFTATLSAAEGDTQTLSVYTTDSGKVATYNLRIKAWYTNYATNLAVKDFTIVVQDDCENNLSLTAASLSNVVYYIHSGNVDLPAFTDFLNSPVYCPITYSTTFTPDPLPSSTTVTLNSSTLVYTIFSDNLAAV